MKKKVVALTLALTLAAGLVTGCGNAKKLSTFCSHDF